MADHLDLKVNALTLEDITEGHEIQTGKCDTIPNEIDNSNFSDEGQCKDRTVYRNLLIQKIFSNHLIFKQILNNCGVETIKNVRLVSNSWHTTSLESWRDKCVARICNWENEKPESNYLSPENLLSITNENSSRIVATTDSILRLSQYPYHNLKLFDWDILESETDRFEEELFFWRNFGPVIKHLHLVSCTINGFYQVAADLAPNMEHLVLDQHGKSQGVLGPDILINRTVKTLRIVGTAPFQDWKFLKCFPNLENLKLCDFSKNFLFEDLKNIRRDSGYSTLNLKSVDIIGTYQRHQGLVEGNFPLESLGMRLDMDMKSADFCKIMKCYGPKLKTLKLFRFPLAWPAYAAFTEFPFNVQLSNLTELHIWGSVASSLYFLKKMPNLKKFVVDLLCYDKHRYIEYWRSRRDRIVSFSQHMMEAEETLDMDEGDAACGKLEHFQIDYKFNVKSIQVLGKWMPNLKILKTILNNESLREVCRQWKGLKELKVMFGSEVDDEGITGMGHNEMERQPNLTDLTELKSFEMESYCGRSKLTDTSARFGFLKMSALQTLKICVSEQMTEYCELDLHDQISQTKLYRNYGVGPHFNDIKCCRRVAFLQRNSIIPM